MYFRNESFLHEAMSESYRKRRQRRYTISIQMTMTSWSLEFLSGIIALVNTLIFGHDDSLEIVTQVLVFIHVFLYFIVIPGSYLLNTEDYKNSIVEKGWGNILSCCLHHKRVVPAQNENLELIVLPEYNNLNRVVSPSVPTISGNVNIETPYKIY